MSRYKEVGGEGISQLRTLSSVHGGITAFGVGRRGIHNVFIALHLTVEPGCALALYVGTRLIPG